jgi:cellulose synthase (UDP-forming)
MKHSHALPSVPPAVPALRRRPTNAVPRLSERQERMIRALAVVTLAYWSYYIVWRWGWTLNWQAWWFSVPLVMAETWGLISGFVMVHSVWRLRHRTPLPAPPGLSVDVFITCYDEPLEVIRRTAVGARAIRYPHQTWILDDGRRDEVKAMAAELRVGYLRRENNQHAKAGNLNNALKHTTGEFILQLDADHVPLPHILDRVLGFFAADPKLAFVQTPQDFYNTDAFTYNVNETSRRIWEEQRLFFGVIQPGKDSLNGSFFCGCSAVIRREALDSIGGFSTATITEDIETSLKLHGAGWNSAFYGESLVYGLAAHSAVAFHTQHLRWGQGGMQVLKRFNPLTFPGLTLSQRISYFGSLTAYVGGVQKLVYFAAPLVFFITGVLPINAFNAEFLLRFIPFLLLSFLLSESLARGRSSTWVAERFHMVKFWTYTRAVLSVFSRKPQTFKVTPKGPGHVPFQTYAPQMVLMVATVVAMVWATVASAAGWVEYPGYGWASLSFISNGFWAAINFALAFSVVRHSLKVRQQRSDHRFRDRFPVSVRVAREGGRVTRAHVALAQDLNPSGMSFRATTPLAEGTALRLTLPLSTATVNVKATVLHCDEVKQKGKQGYWRMGVRFQDVPVNVRDQIELHCTQHAVPLEQSLYGFASTAGLGLVSRAFGWLTSTRRERRETVNLPARVTVSVRRPGEKRRREQVALLEEVSASGARLVTDVPLAPGTPLEYEVPGTDIRGRGHVVFARVFETPVGTSFALGVKKVEEPGEGVKDGGKRAKVRARTLRESREEAAHVVAA